jgi:hypothetical protein
MIGGETRRAVVRRAFLSRRYHDERTAQLHHDFEAALAARRLTRAERQARALKGAATKRRAERDQRAIALNKVRATGAVGASE